MGDEGDNKRLAAENQNVTHTHPKGNACFLDNLIPLIPGLTANVISRCFQKFAQSSK